MTAAPPGGGTRPRPRMVELAHGRAALTGQFETYTTYTQGISPPPSDLAAGVLPVAIGCRDDVRQASRGVDDGDPMRGRRPEYDRGHSPGTADPTVA